jgi:hypothetical protein
MNGSSRLTAAQQADIIARSRDGRPDKAAMSNEERRRHGLMDRRQAAEHERLSVIPCTRPADRLRGPDPDDIWASPAGGSPDAA